MPTPSPSRQFSARFDNLPDLQAFAGAACDSAGIAARVRHHVELVLEEAFSNSIRHGYSGECERPVWLAVSMLPDRLRFIYQDEAPPFDPLLCATLPQDERLGGVGRVLIKTLPRHAEYARIDDRNTLMLEFDRQN